jgi:predicted DNA-binding transcriptional regulator
LEHISTATYALGGVSVLPGNVDRRFLHNGWVGAVHATTEELLKTSPVEWIQKQVSIAMETFILTATEGLFS